MESFEIARINMVKSQILPQNITNQALVDIIAKTPRQIFVPEEKHGISYIDGSINVGGGRYLLPPMVFAKMVEALNLQNNGSVLDIACGTGYSSAILANFFKKVVAVESNTELASRAHLNLNKLGIDNVFIIGNNLADGYEEAAPYDAIFINGAVKEIPQKLFDQLLDNGKLVTILSYTTYSARVVVFTKINGKVSGNDVLDINLPIIEDF